MFLSTVNPLISEALDLSSLHMLCSIGLLVGTRPFIPNG